MDSGEILVEPIHWAVTTRPIEVIDELLGRGADIDAARFDGARPIQLTNVDYRFRGWRDVPPDWPAFPDDPPWATPLAWATRRGHREIAERLAQRSD